MNLELISFSKVRYFHCVYASDLGPNYLWGFKSNLNRKVFDSERISRNKQKPCSIVYMSGQFLHYNISYQSFVHIFIDKVINICTMFQVSNILVNLKYNFNSHHNRQEYFISVSDTFRAVVVMSQ